MTNREIRVSCFRIAREIDLAPWKINQRRAHIIEAGSGGTRRINLTGGDMLRSRGMHRKYLLLAGLVAVNVGLAARTANAAEEQLYKGVCSRCLSPSGSFACCEITACGGGNEPACACQRSGDCTPY